MNPVLDIPNSEKLAAIKFMEVAEDRNTPKYAWLIEITYSLTSWISISVGHHSVYMCKYLGVSLDAQKKDFQAASQ